MRLISLIVGGVAAVAATASIAAWIAAPRVNARQTNGSVMLTGLGAPVTVRRDAKGMAYIHAETVEDALRGQGFVVGQDRLFQVELAKRAAQGRLAEVFGAGPEDAVLKLDRQARVIGFYRLAQAHVEKLDASSSTAIQAFLDGLNAYIADHPDEHPLALRLAGVSPEPWAPADVLAIIYLSAWGNSANFSAELVAQAMLEQLGPERFAEIAPLAINPDDAGLRAQAAPRRVASAAPGVARATAAAWADGWTHLGVGGSNNWAISGAKAGASAAIVTNDPHLDIRDLPGLWHPVGLITPELRVVGVNAGLPGILIGRNEHVAFGVTNAYADVIDLYVEAVDPEDAGRYVEGDASFPFVTIDEVIRIKADEGEVADADGFRDEPLRIRFTRRGPVISDHGLTPNPDVVMTVRWAAAELQPPGIGIDRLMTARSVDEALAVVEDIKTLSLNFVVGDVTGRVARRATGAAPIRVRGDGMTPLDVTAEDAWAGFVPGAAMPGEIDPPRGWTGTANHMTASRDFPYVYTTYASPGFRYRRMQELFDRAGTVTAADAWAAHHDDLNVFAREAAPTLAQALAAAPETADLGAILSAWDHRDRVDTPAPTVFQEIIRQLARLTYEDDLGPELTAEMLSNWYVWHERFASMLQAGASPWFDDARTEEVEDLPILIRRAGEAARAALTERYGPTPRNWRWGAVHRVRFRGPLRLDGLVGRLTGNRDVAMPGSGETLHRALYPFARPFDPYWAASLRMTADLNDPDKVRAVVPGGVVGRVFSRHLADQVRDWLDPDAEVYWWFSDEAIRAATRNELVLEPVAP